MILDPISRICEERKLSKVQFSRKSKIPYTTVLHISKGLSRSMKPFTVKSIAEFTGESPQRIIEEYQEFYNEE